MERNRIGRARHGYGVVLRAVACLLLAIIVADLAADTSCDMPAPATASSSATALRGVALGGPNERCADFCMPDCFCCSRSVAADTAVVPPEPQRLTPVPAPATGDLSEGVRAVPEPPPLAHS
jgi:hypothetical protein